ncbi:MAG: hypothetical protein EP333_09905 [Bacteroidetes bacterium]|nr:MAG: hypothetical protein EP333_09905 [Bacteroidota bacterium]
MKGVIFTEFIEMMEVKYGFTVTNQVIESAGLKSEGIYTSVGTYPMLEMTSLVSSLAAITNESENDLLRAFGNHLFGRFQVLHPSFIERYSNSLDLLAGIEGHIHQEVRKLYDNTELPYFDYQIEDDIPVIYYRSTRNLHFFALGLMEGCFLHFGENYSIELSPAGKDQWKFKLTENAQR